LAIYFAKPHCYFISGAPHEDLQASRSLSGGCHKAGTHRSLRCFQSAALVPSAGALTLQIDSHRKAKAARVPSESRPAREVPVFRRAGACRPTDETHRRTPVKFRPLHDRVVVERIDAEGKSAGGIIIPDTAKEKPQQGKVIAVGPGGRDESGKLIPIDVKAGDRVLFGKWSGTEVMIDGVEYLIMKESDIMGVLVETESRRKAA